MSAVELVAADEAEKDEAIRRTEEYQCRECKGRGCSFEDTVKFCEGYQQELREVKEDRRLAL